MSSTFIKRLLSFFNKHTKSCSNKSASLTYHGFDSVYTWSDFMDFYQHSLYSFSDAVDEYLKQMYINATKFIHESPITVHTDPIHLEILSLDSVLIYKYLSRQLPVSVINRRVIISRPYYNYVLLAYHLMINIEEHFPTEFHGLIKSIKL